MIAGRVFVDTNVLYPVALADLYLSAAELALFEIAYSDDLLDELRRVLCDYKRLDQTKVDVFINQVTATFPGGRIRRSTYEAAIVGWSGPDPDDLVHLAAAVAGGVDVIVTANPRDFRRATPPPGVRRPRVQTPDEHFASLIAEGLRQDILTVIDTMAARTRRPPRSSDEIIAILERLGMTRTIAALREPNTGQGTEAQTQ